VYMLACRQSILGVVLTHGGQHMACVEVESDMDVATVDHPSGHVRGSMLTAV
jgi:hypothetical protein